MANSKYEYVRDFEQNEVLLRNAWIVVRVDGRGFHKLSDHYHFAKPNDRRALDLMNAAASHVVRTMPDLCFAYGVSDEFSFVFDRNTVMFDRRKDKLVSTIVSTFTAAYVHLWPKHFRSGNGDQPSEIRDAELDLLHLPTFDGRAVVYPSTANLRDYLSWRQVDCHINNLYNTTFWTLVERAGHGQREAEELLKGTVSSDKNEILFTKFGINYNNEPEIYRKGSCIYRDYDVGEPSTQGTTGSDGNSTYVALDELQSSAIPEHLSKTQQEKQRKAKLKARVVTAHLDIIQDDFWKQRPWILSGKPPRG
ncbi:tRNA(His) guanylyltransferase [Cyphellophora attinorum]|uniref:tRNA(His) guanylyltransferase n=1 Tax=Cyphellophora attinorum TaxID=1664694 RepID=A0A0N0NKT3_9EURO|nr:tRNA(His) guanylyltransferase [Phialophora attinorum]KPI38398.1 tRNA(His) guanylyltransferase [Phialophora attinorum]